MKQRCLNGKQSFLFPLEQTGLHIWPSVPRRTFFFFFFQVWHKANIPHCHWVSCFKEKLTFVGTVCSLQGFPGGTSGKEPTCQCRRHKRHRFSIWVGKIPVEEGTATYPSALAWRFPQTEEPDSLQSIGSRRVRYHCSASAHKQDGHYAVYLPYTLSFIQ